MDARAGLAAAGACVGASTQRIASGRPGEPVAPLKRTGVKTKRNSLAASRASSSRAGFSMSLVFYVDESALPIGARALAHLAADYLFANAR